MTREEAIKIVQSATVWTDEERNALAMLIPELAESEDERIRKRLIEYFEGFRIGNAKVKWEGLTVQDVLAWLEKQKEQKKEKFPPYVTGFKGHPDPAGTSDLEEAAEKYIQGSMCDLDDGPTVGLAKEAFIAGAEWQKEQKPAEWSEEDKKDMAHIIRILDDCYVYGTHDLSKTDHENLVNKLKSLPPSWKPSEEQMKALLNTLHPDDTVNRSALESLYEQLKAL